MKVAVIGGGPAGMMAAISASDNGADVTLFEQNEKLGKKMYISGKGRCNVTNACSPQDFLKNIPTNAKFLMSAIHKFTPYDLMNFCESHGLSIKTERGNRVFPGSDKSSDVIKTFNRVLIENGVKIALNEKISSVEYQENAFLLTTMLRIISFDRVIIATGGLSYSSTGSTGDGYEFAKKLGHSVTSLYPSLCKLRCKGVKDLEGLSLKNVTLSLLENGKALDSEFGEALFTSDGISGPIALTLSARINKLSATNKSLALDLKPALDYDKLDARILRDFSDRMNKDFINALDDLLPDRLIKAVAEQSGIPFYKKVNQISAAERAKLVHTIKNLTFEYVGLDKIEYAIVTSGGVNVKEINPSTMESKVVSGLYFAGELLDVDAYTGGFNIQIALSTGYVAGVNASR